MVETAGSFFLYRLGCIKHCWEILLVWGLGKKGRSKSDYGRGNNGTKTENGREGTENKNTERRMRQNGKKQHWVKKRKRSKGMTYELVMTTEKKWVKVRGNRQSGSGGNPTEMKCRGALETELMGLLFIFLCLILSLCSFLSQHSQLHSSSLNSTRSLSHRAQVNTVICTLQISFFITGYCSGSQPFQLVRP